nr:MAG TPA: hypothetical protein [Caudoviricetes sp.]
MIRFNTIMIYIRIIDFVYETLPSHTPHHAI